MGNMNLLWDKEDDMMMRRSTMTGSVPLEEEEGENGEKVYRQARSLIRKASSKSSFSGISKFWFWLSVFGTVCLLVVFVVMVFVYVVCSAVWCAIHTSV